MSLCYRTSVLRGERGDEELLYFLELVTMLATCAQVCEKISSAYCK